MSVCVRSALSFKSLSSFHRGPPAGRLWTGFDGKFILRRLCEKDRARPPPELARLFALDKFIFWRVLSFWRSEREMPVCLMNTDVPAPPPPEHQFLPEEKFLPPPPKE